MATDDPRAASEKRATKVAGGQTMRSTFPASGGAPAITLRSSATEAESPFIFQLPATSGRRLGVAITWFPSASRLPDPGVRRQSRSLLCCRALGGGLKGPPSPVIQPQIQPGRSRAPMLRNIHKASSTWLGKGIMAVVMGFLVISFAIWGIADIFRGGFGQNNVASIGSSEITIEQFRQFYNERLQQLSRQAGRPITPDQARSLGLDRQLLGQLIAQTTLDEQARNLHLGLSDAEIARRITSDANFKGPTGQFDRNRFLQIIRDAGYTEPRFVAEQRNVLLRRQIAQTVGG